MTASRKKWSEDETKLALYLYFQLPFGQLHSGNPEIQKLASLLGRTNSSVAMKLCNFASLDPKIVESGRKGLQGASAQDRRIWTEFSQNWTGEIEKVERILTFDENLPDQDLPKLREDVSAFRWDTINGVSTKESIVERRVGQGFFRRAVLANFENKCCITGISEPSLLNASHIVPWGVDVKNRHNPANGLCLSATFDRAFDRGLIALGEGHRVIVSRTLLTHANSQTRECFERFHGNPIFHASRFDPDPNFLKWHRSEIFRDF